MNAEIDKFQRDRLTIGVREWAIERVLGDSWLQTNLVKEIQEGGNTDAVLEMATKLGDYVLEGIKD